MKQFFSAQTASLVLTALVLGIGSGAASARPEQVGEVDTAFQWLGPDHKVVVEVWDKGQQMPDGLGGFNQAPDVLQRTIELNHPTSMTGSDCYITSTRYLVVKEAA